MSTEYASNRVIQNLKSEALECCDVIAELKRDKEIIEKQLKEQIKKIDERSRQIEEIQYAIRKRNQRNFEEDRGR